MTTENKTKAVKSNDEKKAEAEKLLRQLFTNLVITTGTAPILPAITGVKAILDHACFDGTNQRMFDWVAVSVFAIDVCINDGTRQTKIQVGEFFDAKNSTRFFNSMFFELKI